MKRIEIFVFISWIQSVIATVGSLYLSEILHYIPCTLCWYQRIFMYPLSIILAYVFIRKDWQAIRYTLPLTVIGTLIALYHVLIQKIPFFKENSASCGVVSCTEDYLNLFGWITIPILSLTAFLIILLFTLLTMNTWRKTT